MLKESLILLPVVFSAALASAQILGQESGGAEPDLKNAFVGSTLSVLTPRLFTYLDCWQNAQS